MPLQLGKKPFVPDDRDFKLSALQQAAAPLPTPPYRFGHGLAFKDWKMLGNGPDDTVRAGFQGCGCCVWSDAGHATMLVNKLAGHPVGVDGYAVVQDYSDNTGYVVGDDNTDQGTEIREALKFRRSTGTLDSAGTRHKIGAYVSINPKDWDELMQAVYAFTVVSIGFEVPETIWDQFDNHEPWDVVDPDAEIIGGHDIPIVGRYSLTHGGAVSWARRVGFTRAFYETYNDEGWAMIFPEELKNGKTWRGYDVTQLNAWLSALT